MVTAWRIVREKHAAGAFSGEGAEKFGGRWNLRGIPVVYASETKSLAALETLVHLTPPLSFAYVAFQLLIPEELIHSLPEAELPMDWRVEPPALGTKKLGGSWALSLKSAVLRVPSSIIVEEHNLVLNPLHPDFSRIEIGAPSPFVFDPRLLA